MKGKQGKLGRAAVAMAVASASCPWVAQAQLALQGVASAKVHAAAGEQEIAILPSASLTGPISVESRAGPGHRLVFRFNQAITQAGSVAVTDVNGTPIGSAGVSASGNALVVDLAGIEDNRRLAVTLAGVNGSFGYTAYVGFLLGDADGSGAISAADFNAARAQAGKPAAAAGARSDINLSGLVTAVDLAQIKARYGTSLATGAAPTVTLTAPATASTGVTTSLSAAAAVTGGSIVRVEFYQGTMRIGQVTQPPFTLPWTPLAEGMQALSARAVTNSGSSATSPVVMVDVQPGASQSAARLLAQTTFGATRAEIDRVAAMTPSAYLEEQFGRAQTMHLEHVRTNPVYPSAPWSVMSPSIWKQYFEAQDQLRQRVVFALSEIMVISLNNNTLLDQPCGPAAYLDMLGRNAFGNFRTLLKDVTLAPAMGEYLDMKQSAKADPQLNSVPSENYARELLQLFSIGTVMLNADGSTQFGGDGKPLDTYTEETVQEFSRALTGWTFAGQDQTRPNRWLYPDVPFPGDTASAAKACTAWSLPMEPWRTTYRSADDRRNIAGGPHDAGAKVLLAYPGVVKQNVPAGQTPEQDLEDVVDNIFNHPNVGPFIGELLIQRLVTSNPSGAYVARVTAAFNDNGSGVRGDMKAVLRAILLDPEARLPLAAQPPGYGKLREPVIRFTHFHRAFGAVMSGGNYAGIYDLGGAGDLGQSPLRAPSVFNFFAPDFSPTGPLSQNGLYGPEFGITNSATIAGFMDFSKYGIIGGFAQGDADPAKWLRPNYDTYITLAGNPAGMVDALNLLLMSGSMSVQFRNQLVDVATRLTDSNATTQATERVKTVLWLILNSPEYSIQK